MLLFASTAAGFVWHTKRATATPRLFLSTKADWIERFPSLEAPLQSSRLVGVLFAASWCPDCTPIVPKLNQLEGINVIYVSSDNTAEQMQDYMESIDSQFTLVPFEQTTERTQLKRFFGACAAKETRELMVDRQYGIPTLFVLKEGAIISDTGVDDVVRLGIEGAVAKWIKD